MTKQRKNKTEKEVKPGLTGNGDGLPEDQSADINATTEETETTNGQEIPAEQLISDLNKKYQETNEKYLRLYSEFDNYRKRALKERIELSKTASEEMIAELLPVLDDFERAISSFENAGDVEPLKEGTKLVYNKFRNTLLQKGLQEAEALGKPFDTDFHEAIANIPAPSEEMKNRIIDVTQKGYLLNGKVIRFAKVVVGN